MLETLLGKAMRSDETERRQIIGELASRSDDVLDDVIQILYHPKKSLWTVATQVIRAIGYPHNAKAIPTLVGEVGNSNSPAWEEAVQTLVDMGPNVVTPYLIRAMWDRNSHQYWGDDVEGMCLMLSDVDLTYAVACGSRICSRLWTHARLHSGTE